MKNLKVSLAWQILLAMVLGILLGSYLHYHSDSREWLIANLLSPAANYLFLGPVWAGVVVPAGNAPRAAGNGIPLYLRNHV